MFKETNYDERKHAMPDALVGAPHKCGSRIFYQYQRQRDGKLSWYCYKCYPPTESVILDIIAGGRFFPMVAAREYHRGQKDIAGKV